MKKDKITIIGPGRVGKALQKVLTRLGYEIISVLGREDKLVDLGDVVFITTPDAEISKVVLQLLNSEIELSGKVILHCSGTVGLEVFDSIQQKGAEIGCFHPIQAVTEHTNSFEGITFDVMGNKEVIQVLMRLSKEMGAKAMEVSAYQKEMLHVAAVVVSNYQVTLAHIASEIAATSGLETVVVQKALIPLMDSVLANLSQLPPHKALTGPIARGDVPTIAQHLELLIGIPDVQKIYKTLGLSTVDMLENEQLSESVKSELKDLLK